MDKIVLITSGSRGIGAAAALLAAQRGWAVAINYLRHAEAANGVVRQIEAAGGRETYKLVHDTFHHHLAGEPAHRRSQRQCHRRSREHRRFGDRELQRHHRSGGTERECRGQCRWRPDRERQCRAGHDRYRHLPGWLQFHGDCG